MPELYGFQIKEAVNMSSPVVLITGALTGIGRATALAFAREGARVVFSGRHDDEGQKLATELRKLGTEAEFLCTDVRHEEEVKKLVDTSKNRPVVLITGALTGIGCATAHQHRTHGFITRDLD